MKLSNSSQKKRSGGPIINSARHRQSQGCRYLPGKIKLLLKCQVNRMRQVHEPAAHANINVTEKIPPKEHPRRFPCQAQPLRLAHSSWHVDGLRCVKFLKEYFSTFKILNID